MRATSRTLRLLLLLIVGCALLAVPGDAQQTDRAKQLGKRLLCMCGCNQILVECNHVGCTTSGAMLKEMDARVARNEPDDLTLQAFVQEYGEKVLAAPQTKTVLGLTAWLMPIFISLFGFYLVWTIVKRWHARPAVAPAGKARAVSQDLLDRVARETRDTED